MASLGPPSEHPAPLGLPRADQVPLQLGERAHHLNPAGVGVSVVAVETLPSLTNSTRTPRASTARGRLVLRLLTGVPSLVVPVENPDDRRSAVVAALASTGVRRLWPHVGPLTGPDNGTSSWTCLT
jgi:hypothetical protein